MVIDWGDSSVGNPVFDILRLSESVDDDAAAGLRAAWAARWRSTVPGCDPEAAVAALRPVAALRSAAVYAEFLANIEPSRTSVPPRRRAALPARGAFRRRSGIR